MCALRGLAVGLVLGVLLAGCTEELTAARVVPPRSASAQEAPHTVSRQGGIPWRSELCADADDRDYGDRGHRAGALTYSGECNFTQPGPFLCAPGDDDFYVFVKRKLPGGQPFSFFVNVEGYAGHGDYTGPAQTHISVREGQTFYRWHHDEAPIAVTVDGATWTVTLHGVALPAEVGTPAAGSISVDGTVGCTVSSYDLLRAKP
jgi:hypothetical protein